MHPITILALAACAVALGWLGSRYAAFKREAYIREFVFPRGLFDKLRARHPHLTMSDCQLVAQGLRQFFMAYLKSGRQFVSMPSQVADDLWHELILYTRSYHQFCRRAFGGYLHHTPAVVLSSNQRSNAGLRRCWWHVCRQEHINPRAPTRLPLLFALDRKLSISGGFEYVPDCRGVRRVRPGNGGSSPYCGGDFSDPSYDGSTDGFGEGGDHGDAAGGGDGDGCGGGGCGGGD